MPLRLHKTIRVVFCDLYEGSLNACKEVFKNKVPVVADRFHVRKLYRRSLVVLGKAELKRLKRKLSTVEYAELKPAIALLQKHKDYFTEEEKPVVEGFNNKVKVLKRRCYGLASAKRLFQRLIIDTKGRERGLLLVWLLSKLSTQKREEPLSGYGAVFSIQSSLANELKQTSQTSSQEPDFLADTSAQDCSI